MQVVSHTIVRLACKLACFTACSFPGLLKGQELDSQPAAVSSSTVSYAQQVLSPLRDRNLEAALQAFDQRINQTLPLKDLMYSDLPSAAAAVHRSLAQESSGEVYELLADWTLPTDDRQRVRMLSTPVPTAAPPKVFARSIGERPRDTTFVVASVGPVPGFFSSGWMYLQSANELGQLPNVRAKLQELVDQRVTGAEPLYVMSQLLGARGDFEVANAFLQQQIDGLGNTESSLTPNDLDVVAVAAAATEHAETQAAAETFLARMVDRSGTDQAIGLRPLLRLAHAVAVQAYRGESSPSVLFESRLKYWVPVTVGSPTAIQRGQRSGVWLTHEEHVLHLAGGSADMLLFRYPITGSFDFICETQEGGSIGTDGGLVYGGLQFQALGRTNQLTVWNADAQQSFTRPSPFARTGTEPVFNHVSIRSTKEASQFESNFHPVWFDESSVAASPWLGLRSSGTKRPVFRNVRLTGEPQIPQQVQLIAGSQLRGWMSSFYDESQPSFADSRMEPVGTESNSDGETYDWRLEAGQIVGAVRSTPAEAERPGLLQYQRPLLKGESITYEFLHDDESSIVHLAVGRLAFLLESGGVRLRWITTGSAEWTGLEIDNAALEPLYRKGPRPLPIKQGDWNQIRVEHAGDNLLVSVNDVLVYQRPVESQTDTTFGLYRTSRSSEVRVRNAVMTGDWPESIPQEFLDNPLVQQSSSP
ncbi:DUF1583 domain-containing protein [Neorhodopirellula pilleata]|uniref:Uncharacterized protein n=1 Tax=Neorhodopirellula pilleata TaxID=2714738 RepID=A0A5C6ARS2_9BACT|nr:DUF1583 domain-containing protein [Neorhodopirellula pilleata]TWU01662.1 hypothetical protein Pla100_13970 [Neorhodopirellula pilleata]